MRIIEKVIEVNSRSDVFEIYPFGDLHIGARHCAETPMCRVVKEVAENPNAYAVGGGDLLDAILPQDKKRFDFDTLPDWMLEGDAMNVREKLNDILLQQVDRLNKIMSPIPPERWLGAIEGNHEFTRKKYCNTDVHRTICNRLKIQNLSDEALIRLNFRRRSGKNHSSAVVILYLRHGYGGGRTAGAEPMKIARMLDEWECADICFTGHSHSFVIAPPKPVLEIPRAGRLPAECTCRYRWGANWGCWVFSHPTGDGSYASRACYPARPMLTCKAVIKPFASKTTKGHKADVTHIELRQITL